ncbi:uncharacterized protein [Drosophila virilis]|uniref:Uncharacterized protein, isoform C n=1 Tax=Drosophila virilis TaxID=7244 RepID=A0A0Q9WJI8_DROVI|nr:uncharacterized protein LOC6627726 isoform X2 [Drosophila virilis]KRF81348.1 uncharacterized protein Dvir_GJ17159, isoform C [Drosophila virilis]
MNKNVPQVSETGRGVSDRPEGGEESDRWPEASSNPAIKQRACVSCCKNCVVHRLDVESGLRPGSDPQRTADQWDRTDSELQHQDNSWDRNNHEPQPAYTYEPKYKLLANTIDHDYFERPSRRSSTVRNYAEPQGQAHYPPPPPPPPPPPQAQSWSENVDRPCQPPTDAGFGTRLADAQNHPSHQRPTILVIVVNNKNLAGAALNNGYKPVACQVDYREPANQKSVYQDRCSLNGNNPNRSCGPAENQSYWNFNSTYPYPIQEQRTQNGLYDSVSRFDDDECSCNQTAEVGRAMGSKSQMDQGDKVAGLALGRVQQVDHQAQVAGLALDSNSEMDP